MAQETERLSKMTGSGIDLNVWRGNPPKALPKRGNTVSLFFESVPVF